MSEPINPMEYLERIRDSSPKYAQAKANRIYMEEYRKTLKAKLMKSCGLDAIGAQEREAYAHPDYEAHLKALQEAVQQEEYHRWRLVYSQSAIEVWRSQEASNRAIDRASA